MTTETTTQAQTTTQPMMQLPELYRWMCIDLETAAATPDAIAASMRCEWVPPVKRWKDETVIANMGRTYLKALAAKEEKSALLDAAPIISIGIQSDTERRCLHIMEEHAPHDHEGAMVEGFATAADMLVALRGIMDLCCAPDTEICGHNILGFDLPKLRWAFCHHGVRMPTALLGYDQPVFDTMKEYKRYTIKDKPPFISLDELLQLWGLPSHKDQVDGSMVPGLYEKGEFLTIVGYQLKDVIAESQLYLRMTSQLEDLL